MPERIIRLVVKFVPYVVRRAILLEELARAPRAWHNSTELSAEALLRSMAETRGRKHEND